MDTKTTIDQIVWYIPFKKLRNNIRNYMYTVIRDNNFIEDNKFIKDSIKYIINDTNNFIILKDWERSFITAFKDNINKDKEFFNKYKKLILNLDKESVDIITTIISRISNFNDKNNYITISNEEMKIIKYTEKYIEDKIIKINDNCYLFDNKYLLNRKSFETFTFHPKHQLGISYLKNQNKIKEKSMIDAGAWIGDTSIFLSYMTKDKVYAFEPIYKNYDEIKKNIELNNLNNVEPIWMALGEENKKIYLENLDIVTMMGTSTNLENSDGKIEVDMTTLDKFVEDNKLEVGFIKTDLEGFEQPFLRGALNTIKTQKPALMISIYHNYSDFLDIKPMIENLNLGYKFKIVKPEEPYILGGTVLIAEVY